MWCMVAGHSSPYKDMGKWRMMAIVASGERPKIDAQKWAQALADVVRACWAQDPKSRPSFSKLSEEIDVAVAAIPTSERAAGKK